MRITESKLRKIIRQVIKESQHNHMDTYKIKDVPGYGDSLYYTLYEYLQNQGYGHDHDSQNVLDNCSDDIMHLAQLLAQYQNAVNHIKKQEIEDSIMRLESRFIECPEVFEYAKSMI